MSACKHCIVRGKTWNGSDPKCAFESGIFSSDNWNCATANKLRDIMELEDNFRQRRNDSSIGLLYVPEICDDEGYFKSGSFWILGKWYKERGQTDYLVSITGGEHPPDVLTLVLAEEAIEAYKNKFPKE